MKPTKRLGYGPDGTKNVKNHKFFKSVDWNAIRERTIKPPFEISIEN